MMQNKFNSQLKELIEKNNDNINAINDKYQRMIMETKKKAEEEKKLSPETMGNYVSRNIENAYENSNTERDFINYFKREAEEQGIDLTNEDNENTLNGILEPYIKIFLKRKKEKKTIEEQSQYIRRLKLQLENEHENYLKSQRENSRLIETLKYENENFEIEIKKREKNFK